VVELVCCGAINWDMNLFTEKLPRTGEEVPVQEIQRVSGGTAANVSVAAARILGPGRVAFIGALGDDEIAAEQLTILKKEGVESSGVLRVPGVESGQAYITIDSRGANEIHTYFGANLCLSPKSLREPERLRLIRGASVTVIMDPPLESAEVFAGLCKEGGGTVIWDPGVYAGLGIEAFSNILGDVDYLILNHLEFENLLGTSEPEEVGAILSAKKKGLKIIIKRGREGCILCGGAATTTTYIGTVPLRQFGFKVVNTVGCGDAFIGAFAAAKVDGMEDLEALRWGCAAGSFKATRMETRGSPMREELNELLRCLEEL
jgi:ribokinase